MMMKYFIASICIVVLVVAVNSAHAEQEHHQLQQQQAQTQQQQHQLANEEYRTRLLQLLLADLAESDEQQGDAESAAEDDGSLDLGKRMSYRYGKRMSYRYGKRSAMPYRFGKRGAFAHSYYPSAQHILDYIKLHENNNGQEDDLSLDKRMSYRYGRSTD